MDEQRTGSNAHPERDFFYLQDKSPVELIAEMEDLISEMSAEDFDNEQVQAYLAALRAKTPATADFDPQASFARFMEQKAAELEQAPALKPQRKQPKRFFRRRLVYVAATILLVLFVGSVTVSAYGVNIFASFIEWGEEVLKISRDEIEPASGSLELPEDSDAQYHSMADALKQYGLSADVCPTWIPERYNLAVVEVQKANEEISFSALYYDSEGNPMSFSIDYGLSPQTIHYIEKDPGSEETYIDHGVEYLLMTNMGDWTAHWMDETSSYLLTGNITKDELKRMLNSIYER